MPYQIEFSKSSIRKLLIIPYYPLLYTALYANSLLFRIIHRFIYTRRPTSGARRQAMGTRRTSARVTGPRGTLQAANRKPAAGAQAATTARECSMARRTASARKPAATSACRSPHFPLYLIHWPFLISLLSFKILLHFSPSFPPLSEARGSPYGEKFRKPSPTGHLAYGLASAGYLAETALIQGLGLGSRSIPRG